MAIGYYYDTGIMELALINWLYDKVRALWYPYSRYRFLGDNTLTIFLFEFHEIMAQKFSLTKNVILAMF